MADAANRVEAACLGMLETAGELRCAVEFLRHEARQLDLLALRMRPVGQWCDGRPATVEAFLAEKMKARAREIDRAVRALATDAERDWSADLAAALAAEAEP